MRLHETGDFKHMTLFTRQLAESVLTWVLRDHIATFQETPSPKFCLLEGGISIVLSSKGKWAAGMKGIHMVNVFPYEDNVIITISTKEII